MTHHGRPGGRAMELLALLLLLLATAAIVVGTVFIVSLLVEGMSRPAFGLGFLLSVPLWRAFLSYYKYRPHSLEPIIEKDGQK